MIGEKRIPNTLSVKTTPPVTKTGAPPDYNSNGVDPDQPRPIIIKSNTIKQTAITKIITLINVVVDATIMSTIVITIDDHTAPISITMFKSTNRLAAQGKTSAEALLITTAMNNNITVITHMTIAKVPEESGAQMTIKMI